MPRLGILFLLLGTMAGTLAAQPSRTVNLSGRLTDAGGLPVSGPVDITVSIYATVVGGSPIYQEVHTGVMPGAMGEYRLVIGGFVPLADSDLAGERWLGLDIGGAGELVPRLPMASTASAFDAHLLGGAPPSTYAPRAELADGTAATTPVGWADLAGVPGDILDGDDDTTYAAGAGLGLMGGIFSASFAGSGSATTIARSDHDHVGLYVRAIDLATSDGSPPNMGANLVHWDVLSGVPGDLVDGDQDTTYSAGAGLLLGGDTFSADVAGTGSAATLARSDHDHPATDALVATLGADIAMLQAQVAALMAAASSGGFSYPDGTSGLEPVVLFNLQSTPYVVPAGKNLYLSCYHSLSSSAELTINGNRIFYGYSSFGGSDYNQRLEQPVVVAAGQSLSASTDSVVGNGFLVPAGVTPVTRTTLSTTPYAVPAGMVLVILNYHSLSSSAELLIAGRRVFYGYSNFGGSTYEQVLGQPIVVPAGALVSCSTDSPTINGYLRTP